jgi:hypothetical protein
LHKVIVDGYDVHRETGKTRGACDERRRQRFAFTGRHLGQHPFDHGKRADDLDVEMPHAEDAF